MDAAMTSTTDTTCPNCGSPVAGTDLFCEACGAALKPAAATPASPALDTDTEPTVEIDAVSGPDSEYAGPCTSCGGTVCAE